GFCANFGGKAVALPLVQELGIAQSANTASRVEDHGRRHDRARERAPAGLVDAGDKLYDRRAQHDTPAARNSVATASAARPPVSALSEAANPANKASRRRRVTVSS